MNQEIIDSLSLLIAYTIVIAVGYSWQHYLIKLRKQKETPKQTEPVKNVGQEQSPLEQLESQSCQIAVVKEEIGLLELFLFSNKLFKQNKQDYDLLKIGKYLLYISNNLMIISIMNSYYGIDDFNKSCWLLGLLLVPIYDVIQIFLFLFAYLLACKILKRTQINNIEVTFILVGYFYFILGNLVIVSSLNGNEFLIDKAFSISGIQYILEIILTKVNDKVDFDMVQKLDYLLKNKL